MAGGINNIKRINELFKRFDDCIHAYSEQYKFDGHVARRFVELQMKENDFDIEDLFEGTVDITPNQMSKLERSNFINLLLVRTALVENFKKNLSTGDLVDIFSMIFCSLVSPTKPISKTKLKSSHASSLKKGSRQPSSLFFEFLARTAFRKEPNLNAQNFAIDLLNPKTFKYFQKIWFDKIVFPVDLQKSISGQVLFYRDFKDKECTMRLRTLEKILSALRPKKK